MAEKQRRSRKIGEGLVGKEEKDAPKEENTKAEPIPPPEETEEGKSDAPSNEQTPRKFLNVEAWLRVDIDSLCEPEPKCKVRRENGEKKGKRLITQYVIE